MKYAIIGAAMAAASLFAANAAQAETYLTLDAGVETMDFKAVGGTTANLQTIGGKVTWRKSWYGVEGDLYFGLNKDTVLAPVKVKVNSAAFIYGVAFLPVAKNFDLFAKAGYGHQATDISGGGASLANDGAFVYGGGAQVMFNEKNGARLDYTHLDIDQVPSNQFTLGYVRKF